ncbi:MAG: hypothetical protein IJ802_02200 [Kiritimatiellae bacterium]|nr:hypothetical protein [Kiritimatiellia bacterium]
MDETGTEEGFVSFRCGNCREEIEASLDMVGVEAACPGCGARIIVPSPAQLQAMKRRTIRIEIGDLFGEG